MKQTTLASLLWFKKEFEKEGFKLLSHEFYKNQQVLKFIDSKGRKITKQIFNPDEFGRQAIVVRCKEGIPLREMI